MSYTEAVLQIKWLLDSQLNQNFIGESKKSLHRGFNIANDLRADLYEYQFTTFFSSINPSKNPAWVNRWRFKFFSK